MSSSKSGSWLRYGYVPAGPSWPRIISPFHRRRRMPGDVLELRARDRLQAHGLEQRVEAAAEAEREPATGEPVHRGRERRGHHRVAGVVVRRARSRCRGVSLDGPGRAAESVAASLRLNRSEMNAEPRPMRSASRTSVDEVARRVGVTRERVEAELVQLIHLPTASRWLPRTLGNPQSGGGVSASPADVARAMASAAARS